MKNLTLSIFFLISIILSADIFGRPVDDENGNKCFDYIDIRNGYTTNSYSRRKTKIWPSSENDAYQRKWVLTCGKSEDLYYAEELAKEKSAREDEINSLEMQVVSYKVKISNYLANLKYKYLGGTNPSESSQELSDGEKRLSELRSQKLHQEYLEDQAFRDSINPCFSDGWGGIRDEVACNKSKVNQE